MNIILNNLWLSRERVYRYFAEGINNLWLSRERVYRYFAEVLYAEA